jgi:hypothetical protein
MPPPMVKIRQFAHALTPCQKQMMLLKNSLAEGDGKGVGSAEL